jgi:CRISPR/Cas system-associated protein endoribonuclease Cas2
MLTNRHFWRIIVVLFVSITKNVKKKKNIKKYRNFFFKFQNIIILYYICISLISYRTLMSFMSCWSVSFF